MRALIQRVSSASVSVDDEVIGKINSGLLVFLGVAKNDDTTVADKLLTKVLNYRVFSDENDKMNLNIQQAHGELLIISQFTLVAETNKGLRPSFSSAAPPAHSEQLYKYFIQQAESLHKKVAHGRFGANMQVNLINNGPVTFLLEA